MKTQGHLFICSVEYDLSGRQALFAISLESEDKDIKHQPGFPIYLEIYRKYKNRTAICQRQIYYLKLIK